MGWVSNGDSSSWVEDTPQPGQFVGGGGDAPGQFIPTIAPQYSGGGGDAMGTPIPLSQDYINSIQPDNSAPSWLAPQDYAASGFSPAGVSQSFGGLFSNTAQIPNAYQSRQSQLSTNPDPTQAFNFVSNPYVNKSNSFSGPINNAIQSYLGRPATQAEIQQYSQQLAQNPDSYNTIVENIRNSAEAERAAKTGIQNLIIDPRQGDVTGGWLNSSYGQYKPTDESFFSKLTNAVGSAIPYAGLGIMTGGLGAAAGLGGIASGALAGGVTGAAKTGIDGGNLTNNVLLGTLLGGAGGAASSLFSGAAPSSIADSLRSSYGLDLGTGFTGPAYNGAAIPAYGLTTNNVISNAGNSFINNLGPGTLNAGNALNIGTGNNAVPNGGSSFANNVPNEFQPASSLASDNQALSTLTQNNAIGPFEQMKPGDVQVSNVDPNSYFIKNADQTLSAVTPAGTIQVPPGSENQILTQASNVSPIDWSKGDQYIADASNRAGDIQNLTRPLPLATPNQPYGQGSFLGMDQTTNVAGANANEPYMQQIADKASNNLPYSSAIQEGTTFYTDPITGQQIPVELATPQATSSTVSGTGAEGVAQTYSAGPNEYVGLPDGTFLKSNVETGVETIVDSLPKDAVPINAGNGANPINGANTFANLSTGEILSGAGGAAALDALLNNLGVGSGGPGAGANGSGPGTGGGGNGTGGNGTGTGGSGLGVGTGGTGTGGVGTGTGGGTGTGKGGVGGAPAALSKLLKKPVLYQSAPGGLYRGNQNPFTFGKDVPIQNPFASYDPFAALNVPQAVPKSDADLLANLLREHIYG